MFVRGASGVFRCRSNHFSLFAVRLVSEQPMVIYVAYITHPCVVAAVSTGASLQGSAVVA